MTGARGEASDAALEVAILVFDGVEVLDFAGPFEVFSVASELAAEAGEEDEDEAEAAFRVHTPSPGTASIRAVGGLEVVPSHRLEDCPGPDVLIVPGGVGVRALLGDERVLGWVRSVAHGVAPEEGSGVVASVCTGALLLAEAGLLDGREAVTHHRHLDELEALARRRGETVRARGDVRFLDHGPVATAGGIAAGIDLALHLVERFRGPSLAGRTAAYMEVPWHGREGWRREAAPVSVSVDRSCPDPSP